MNRFVFVVDKFNKYSIKALNVAFEKWYDFDYDVIKLDELKPFHVADSVVFCSFNTLNSDIYFQMVKKLKNESNLFVCGGPHPSARPYEVLEWFDSVCIGEGEIVLKEIVNDCLGKNLKKVYRSKQKIDLSDYSAYPRKKRIFGPIEITRGCYFRCKYCQTPSLFPGKVRHKDLSSVFCDVEYAFANRKFDFRFITPDASAFHFKDGLNLNMIETLFKGIKSITKNRGRIFFGSFPSEINPFFVNKELIKLMKMYCSNKKVVIGLQTVSENLLYKINRPIDVEKVENVINWFLAYDFEVDVDFIFGLPGESENDVLKSIGWIEKWNKKVRIHAHYFMPLPGTPFENEKPSPLSEKSIQALRTLEGEGKIFGQWVRQMEFTKKLVAI